VCRRAALNAAVSLERLGALPVPMGVPHRPGCTDHDCRCPILRGVAYEVFSRDLGDRIVARVMANSERFDTYLRTGATEVDMDAALAALVRREVPGV
jgi:hypothetical protein